MTNTRELAHQGRIVGSEVYLRVGLHTLRFWSPDPSLEFFVHSSHEPFVVAEEDADCDVRWEIGEVRPSATPVIRTSGDRWEVRRDAEGWEEFTFFGVGHVPDLVLRVSPDMRNATAVRSPRGPDDRIIFASEHPWSEFLVCRLVGRDGGVLLHASSAVVDGGALLFVGHSGAGKSTICEIAEGTGAAGLSDDRTIVTFRDGKPIAWGTPWHGSFARTSSASAEVSGLFLLVQDTVDRVDPISGERALKELFVRLIQPRITAEEVSNTLDALAALVAARPLHALHFQPTPAAVHLARSVAAKSFRGER